MKIIAIVVAVIVVGIGVVQWYAAKSQKDIEQYPYKVLKTYPEFETRAYAPTLFTSVQLQANTYEKGSRSGFSILAGYIFGGNEKNEKIAMTSPVSMSLGDSMTMMFMVPRNLKKEDLPKPNEANIEFKEEPAKTMAAIQFGGWADDEKIDKYRNKLTAALDKEGIAYTNKFYFFGYNAPYELLNRKNEIIVELP